MLQACEEPFVDPFPPMTLPGDYESPAYQLFDRELGYLEPATGSKDNLLRFQARKVAIQPLQYWVKFQREAAPRLIKEDQPWTVVAELTRQFGHVEFMVKVS